MARVEIDKKGTRAKLVPRREPYWGAPVERGLFLGFRRLEHGGNWIARCRTDEGQRYLSLGVVSDANDYEAATKEARRWRKLLEAGVDSAEVSTVAEACADYAASLRRAKREKTAADSERRFARTIDGDPLGKVKLSQLRVRHLEAWRDRMEAGEFAKLETKKGRPPTTKPMTPAAFKRTLTVLKAALNHAVRKRYMSADKAIEWKDIQPDKGADGRREIYLDKEQRRSLLATVPDDLRDLLTCIAMTGCRPGDPAAMLRKDFDQRTGSVTFRTKTGNRTIPVSPAAEELFVRLAKGRAGKALMFVRADGKAWTPTDWAEGIRAALPVAGLPAGVVAYSLRHSWITDAIVGGLDLLTVAKLTGTSLAMIEKHYGHLVHGAARDKLARLEFL